MKLCEFIWFIPVDVRCAYFILLVRKSLWLKYTRFCKKYIPYMSYFFLSLSIWIHRSSLFWSLSGTYKRKSCSKRILKVIIENHFDKRHTNPLKSAMPSWSLDVESPLRNYTLSGAHSILYCIFKNDRTPY